MLNSLVDATNLKTDAREADIIALADKAAVFGCASVCVYPKWLPILRKHLKSQGQQIKLCTVVGFPHGSSSSSIKAQEAVEAVYEGATEIDMVADISAIKDGAYDVVRDDIAAVKQALDGVANDFGDGTEPAILKVIIETDLLTDEEIVKTCEACADGQADFVKTSTGMVVGGHGATAEHVLLIASVARGRYEVKASGGIRDLDKAFALIDAGASRLGMGDISILED